MTRRTRLPFTLLPLAVAVVTTVLPLLATVELRARAARQDSTSRGSVTLEQAAIAAGLLAIAVAAVAVLGKAVTHYTDLLN